MFEAWGEADREWAIALDQYEHEQDQKRCPNCVDTTGACQDPDLQHAWDIDTRVCYVTKTKLEYMHGKRGDEYAARLVLGARMDPTRIKRTRNRVTAVTT